MGCATRSIRPYGLAILLLFIWVLAGCSSGKNAGSDNDGYIEEARRYEEEFRPSEFDPDPAAYLKHADSGRGDTASAGSVDAPDHMEVVTGFRVQIFSSSSIDDANSAKESAEAQFKKEQFYVVYEPPTYKLRAGDFKTRYEADRFARQLREHGYKDAWIVPEKVYKNPGSR